ncbi:MAG: Serine hydroxymethyltransferase [candidate division TM6 bacterium GW2011_GWE2_41_16]|nr:MAG: Serine hydroxymethyltransferase [candidate division TM6 bacterium GW2011_GWE2_41_16]
MQYEKNDHICSISDLIALEESRQNLQLSFIASENYAPQAVRSALGSLLGNKYAEGYPKKRYYAGCNIVDSIEECTIKSCKKLFDPHDLMHANVQPHSGSGANMAAYMAFAEPGSRILGMHMFSGGHLTHGNKASFSSSVYQALTYKVDYATGFMDYAEIERLAQSYRPKIIMAGASAYSRKINFERLAEIALQTNAIFIADIAHVAGLIVAGLYPNPVGYADCVTGTTQKTLRGPRGGFILCKKEFAQKIDRAVMPGIQGGPFMNVIAAKGICFDSAATQEFKEYQKQVLHNAQIMTQRFKELGYTIVSGGTDTHLFIIDLRPQKIDGKAAEEKLEHIGIITSRSTIPDDYEKPFTGSGIRLGTAAITTRKISPEALLNIVDGIDACLKNGPTEYLKNLIEKIASQFPIPD